MNLSWTFSLRISHIKPRVAGREQVKKRRGGRRRTTDVFCTTQVMTWQRGAWLRNAFSHLTRLRNHSVQLGFRSRRESQMSPKSFDGTLRDEADRRLHQIICPLPEKKSCLICGAASFDLRLEIRLWCICDVGTSACRATEQVFSWHHGNNDATWHVAKFEPRLKKVALPGREQYCPQWHWQGCDATLLLLLYFSRAVQQCL